MENNINAYPETNLFKTNKHDEQNMTKAIKASGVNSLPKPTICDNKRIGNIDKYIKRFLLKK